MTEQHKPHREAHTAVNIYKEDVDLTYENTTVYRFGTGYEAMNHLYIRDILGRKALFLYHSPGIVEQLIEQEYPQVFAPEPDENEVNAYVDFQTNVLLERELKEMAGND